MILSDRQITANERMITPFTPKLVREQNGRSVVSYGLSSYGYDFRLNDKILLQQADPLKESFGILDVRENLTAEFENTEVVEWEGGRAFMLPPHAFALATTMEKVSMPEDVIGVAQGKSTYARVGLQVLVTPVEPGYEGHLTIGLVNTTDAFIPLYVGEGILQMMFLQGSMRCATSYRDRKGKYQGSGDSPVLPRV